MKVTLLFIFAVLMFSDSTFASTPPIEPGVPRELARWRAEKYSGVRYRFDVEIVKMSPSLKGTVEIRVSVADGSPIILDWRKNRGLESVYGISNVQLNGVAAKFEEVNEHLVFREGVVAGENLIRLNFSSPIATSGAALTRYVDKEDGAEYVYSLFVPSDASTAFPVFDQPDLKARFSLKLQAPEGWSAVSNTEPGPQRKRTGNEGGSVCCVYEFPETKPISTYVFAFAAGEFASVQDPKPSGELATRIFLRKSQTAKFKPHSDEVFRLNREAVRHLESYFDYRFPFPKYDIVLIPEFPFGGMEHAGATFLREASVIFPTEPTKNDYVSRANVIFHEAAHQWFGDTVTMEWFDDLWLKEGFAEFMAYKTLEKVMPEYNAWKIFYERNKQAAYLTDSTKGTTPIYQEIPNLSAAKSAYGNIVYRKAPSFLKQAEFYLGEEKFQTAVRNLLKKNEYSNAGWEDLVSDFARARFNLPETGKNVSASDAAGVGELLAWANSWIRQPGAPVIRLGEGGFTQTGPLPGNYVWTQKFKIYEFEKNRDPRLKDSVSIRPYELVNSVQSYSRPPDAAFVFPNYEDFGYGIFLLDKKSREYVLANIRNEKNDFLRTMMWGSLWDSVREAELAPRDYVELVIRNLSAETDESTIQTLLGRVSTAMNYYLSDAERRLLAPRVEAILLANIAGAKTQGQRITFYRAYLNLASSPSAARNLKNFLAGTSKLVSFTFKTKDRFDIVTRLLIMGDKDAPMLLSQLEKTETSDEARRYAYAAKAGIGTAANKEKFWNDFVSGKDIPESWIEAAVSTFNTNRHSELTQPYLERALAELPNLKRNRKIFFVNGWLGAFIGGQKSEQALAIVNKFLADNPKLDRDLKLKILENADNLERAVRIRKTYQR